MYLKILWTDLQQIVGISKRMEGLDNLVYHFAIP